ncbi:MerR family transcriptional regulator [Streptomyces lavendulocolor]|uniref:MerR family transcriptional regulator n=1 Tax=Streptomyces lavendulocolor TaxID=67316 RepID=UPI003C30132A
MSPRPPRFVVLSTHILRHYEQKGLVRPARNASGYREYRALGLRRLARAASPTSQGNTPRRRRTPGRPAGGRARGPWCG